MPIGRCLYCGKLDRVSLWWHACPVCHLTIIKPALAAGEAFVPVPGSLGSVLPEKVKEEGDAGMVYELRPTLDGE